ncbi:MAG: tryptophanyl-tRNA synthetase, tryptophanyl-tRNA synthetase [candidate division WS6 bacterium GW2011_GWF1_33_233]|nr:MAG: tryptophanyl-tRNA synthetase, tryptophanyl-tRNA synthetase [candidate division WS6 bacterium GW2011_GWF1_33_233]
MKETDYKVDVFTGIRPSGGLTIANVIGSVHTIVKLQSEEHIGRPMVFVADLHALTDAEPKDTQKYVIDVVKDYIALGLNPSKNDIFVQSQIVEEIGEFNLYLSRLISIAELMRVPTLKEKIKKGMSENTANALLAMYPIMMSADILLQKSKFVPVGEDQVAHVEMTRVLATKFNKRYGEVLAVPRVLSLGNPARIKSLDGNGKMSKSNPSGAILLDDPIEISLSKVKIYLENFQKEKALIKDEDVKGILQRGSELARKNAKETIAEVRKAMSLEYV